MKTMWNHLLKTNMKRYLFALSCLCTSFTGAKAWDFALPNQNGDTIYYSKYTDKSVTVTNSGDPSIVYDVDTLYIPESIVIGDTSYIVEALEVNALFYGRVKVVVLPKTIHPLINTYLLFGLGLANDSITDYIVDSNHPRITSLDGVIYSKNLDSLLCFPMSRRGDYKFPPQTSTICDGAFFY